ncbi:MAG: L,D-transpeptidase family protein [bacterium]
MDRKFLLLVVLIFIFMITFIPGKTSANEHYFSLQNHLVRWFEFEENPFYLQINSSRLQSADLIYEYYQSRGFKPVWNNRKGINPWAEEFLEILEDSWQDGLFPEEYHLTSIRLLKIDLKNADNGYTRSKILSQIDLLLTDAFFVFISDLMSGRIDPDDEERIWVDKNLEKKLMNLLNKVDEKEDPDYIAEIIKKEINFLPEYDFLKEALARYRDAKEQGGWPLIEGEEFLRPGDEGKRVKTLRQRLQLEPDIGSELDTDDDHYDQQLQKAVFNFQSRYGLVLTGMLDENTLQALKISVQEVIDQIIINMERMRWLSQDPEGTYVVANVPSYNLQFVKEGEHIREERTIVGTEYRQTPSFSTAISRLVFNPRWYIPRSIAVKDYLPHVKEDISYLEEKNVRVYENSDSGFTEVDPETIDWDEVTKDNFDLYFWQDSGPWNALGDVIFQSPSSNHIYIHDTSNQDLFENRVRTFSSGCVRVHNAMKLAEFFIEHFTDKSQEDMKEILERGKETSVSLNQRIPLHFTYFTSWITPRGSVLILDDIYDKDDKLQEIYFGV